MAGARRWPTGLLFPMSVTMENNSFSVDYMSKALEAGEQSEVQKLRGELEAESLRLPEAHRLSAGHMDQFMNKARRSLLTRPEAGLAEFRALCERLGVTAQQVCCQIVGAPLESVL